MTTPTTPPLTLSLEEIEALEDNTELSEREQVALLSMARRLLELESAGEHLAQSDRRVVLVVDYRAPGEATYDCRARCLPQVAETLGWDPTKAGR